jgi:hypothetical protein
MADEATEVVKVALSGGALLELDLSPLGHEFLRG